MSNELLVHARRYAITRAWRILPVHTVRNGRCTCRRQDCPHPGKHPLPPHGVNEATADTEVIDRWWEQWPSANVGVACGDGLLVLDVDPRHGGDEELAALEDEFGALPHTAEVVTGGGGRHVYFSAPDSSNGITSCGLRSGVELKAAGAYVIAPPSVHPSGQRYLWEVEHDLDNTPLAQAPGWLLGLARERRQPRATPPVQAVIREGGRNATLTSLAGSMRWKGMEQPEIRAALAEVNRRRCKPPLPDEEVAEIAASVCRYPAAQTLPVRTEPSAHEARVANGQARAEAMAFPEKAFLGYAGDLAELFSRYTEAPKSFYFMTALTCLGNLVCRRITLASVLRPQPRLYTVILGESGDDRKSTAIRLTVEFFLEALGPERFAVSHGVGSAEGLADELALNRELLLVSDEFKTFINKAKIESSVLLPCVNTLFESNRYHSATKCHRIALDDVHLSLVAACTKDTYSTVFGRAFTDVGFINRLFVVLDSAKRRFHLPPQIPEEETARLRGRLQDLVSWVDALCEKGEPCFMPLTPEADETFRRWYENLPRSIFAKRLDTYGHRLMLLLAVSAGAREVSAQVAQAVVAMLDYEFAVRRIADPVDAENKIAELEERIRRALARGPVPEKGREGLRKSLHYERYGFFIWNAAISNLEKAGDIRRDSQGLLALIGEA